MHSGLHVFSVSALMLPVILLVVIYMFIRKEVGWTTHTALVICLAICTVAIYHLWMNEQQSHFTKVKWTLEQEERVWMVDDMLSQYEFVGMDVLAVESILGKETDTSYFEAPNRLVYYLGSERGFISIDSEWLVFDMNEKSVVTNVQILHD